VSEPAGNFADQLLAAAKEKGAPVVVGIDPRYDLLPEEIVSQEHMSNAARVENTIDAVLAFCTKVIQLVAPYAAAVKLNSAFFEALYWDGIETYYSLVQEAAGNGLLVIGDVKRADIGTSSERYAAAHLADPSFETLDDVVAPDAVTVNPYLGSDGVTPFIEAAKTHGKGVFVLVRTSNESADQVQGLLTADGAPVYRKVGQLVQGWAQQPGLIGPCGYSAVGAVVAATDAQAAAELREVMPNCLFLVPGYGAQGGTAETVKPCFKADGTGSFITASRSVIYAFNDPEYNAFDTWEEAVEAAARKFNKEIAALVGG
jgi:orotidine-5'-phosphate decarboxylase